MTTGICEVCGKEGIIGHDLFKVDSWTRQKQMIVCGSKYKGDGSCEDKIHCENLTKRRQDLDKHPVAHFCRNCENRGMGYCLKLHKHAPKFGGEDCAHFAQSKAGKLWREGNSRRFSDGN